MDDVTLDINFLTPEELEEYRTANLKITEIRTIVFNRKQIKQKSLKQKEHQNTELQNIEEQLEAGIKICKLFKIVGLCESTGEARRLIKQRGLYINRKAIENMDQIISKKDAFSGSILLQKGKNSFYELVIN